MDSDACKEVFLPYLEASAGLRTRSSTPRRIPRRKDGWLREIAGEAYGLRGQPHIVFKHKDIDRQHLHVVSLRVDENGHKLSHDFETE